MGFSTVRATGTETYKIGFQSLEGIFGFFNFGDILRPRSGGVVSIPRRDFWVFQQEERGQAIAGSPVSIPRRDFWVFQRRTVARAFPPDASFNP
ncbi:hypothetical protein CKA32_005585 [Geitlerinema sp. FC II]|nr:hypothetical protein CKA32_005585 [Geitlerinema sp. FC II]